MQAPSSKGILEFSVSPWNAGTFQQFRLTNQLDYRAHIPPGDSNEARAIEVTTNPDPSRAWTPVLAIGEHRVFDPEVNRFNLAPPDKAPHYGSSLNLSAANSTATVNVEMKIE